MLASEKAPVCRQRGRMGSRQYTMPSTVDKSPFFLSIRPPQHKHDMLPFIIQSPDHGIRKLFPAFSLMRTGLMGTYRQCGIEQQHTLLRPTGQVPALRHRCPQIRLYFLEYILQGRRKGDSVIDGKTQTMRLPWPVIRVLSDNNHLRFVIRTEVESIKNQLSRRPDKKKLYPNENIKTVC